MSGAGRKPVVGSYRTERVTYRVVESADANIDAFEEVIDTREDATVNDSPTTTGSDCTLAIYALLGGEATAATLQLYAKATDESAEEPSSSSSGSVSSWAFHSEFSVDAKGLLRVTVDLPADEYKVMVTSITGTGEVVIRESHSL